MTLLKERSDGVFYEKSSNTPNAALVLVQVYEPLKLCTKMGRVVDAETQFSLLIPRCTLDSHGFCFESLGRSSVPVRLPL